MAALRGGIKTVLIPKDNEKDLAEIPDNVKRGMTIIPVGTVDEVLYNSLTGPLVPIEWDQDQALVTLPKVEAVESDIGVITH